MPQKYSKKRSSVRSTKKSYKKATNRKNIKKSVAKPKSATKVLAKQVKALQKAVKVDKALHTWKQSDCTAVKSLAGRCNHVSVNGVTTVQLEAACTNLRFYDPATPGTLVTANQNTGTFARDVFFREFYTKLLMRNNYQVPVRVKVYLCKVKNDNSNSALATYITALADQVITAGTDETDQLMYLTDMERVKEYWSVDCVVDKLLEPGKETTTTHSVSGINFDPANIDDDSSYFQQHLKCFHYVIRIEGVLGHDNAVATEQTLLPAGLDVMIHRKAVIEYDAGIALNDIFIQEDRIVTFTNGGTTGGVVSSKPVSDNLAYSIA